MSRSIEVERAPAQAIRGVQWRSYIALFVILAATALLYLPTLRYAFVYDDRYQILRNPRIASWRYLGAYFTHHIWIHQSPAGSYYRPVFLVWLRLNEWIFGLQPPAWHATTIVLHLAAVTLVYFLLRRTIDDRFVVNVATAIFAIHPAHLESVAWVSGLTDPLMALPLLGSLLCWLWFRERRRGMLLAASLLLMLVSLFAKETAVILPALVFVYEYALDEDHPARWRMRSAYREAVPFAFTFAAFWAFRTLILFREHLPLNRPVRDILVNLPGLSAFYARHLFWPFPVGIYYDVVPIPWRWSAVPAGIVCLAVVGLAGYLAAQRSPVLFIAWAWIVFPVATVIASLPVFFSPHDCVHDRYLYLATIGLGIAIAKALSYLKIGSLRAFGLPLAQLLATLAGIALLTFALLNQMPQWRDDLALFTQGVRTAAANPTAYNDLGFQLYLRNRVNEAHDVYAKDVAMHPDDPDANIGMALMSFQLERWSDAASYCHRANALAPPGTKDCSLVEARALFQLGRRDEAETEMRSAIQHWPKSQGLHVLLGRILASEDRRGEAREEFLQEIELADDPVAAEEELRKLDREPTVPAKPRRR